MSDITTPEAVESQVTGRVYWKIHCSCGRVTWVSLGAICPDCGRELVRWVRR